MLKNSTNGEKILEGFAIDLIHKLSSRLAFNYSLQLHQDGNFGAHNNYGEFTGLMAELIYDRADLVIGDIAITAEREAYVDFTLPLSLIVFEVVMILTIILL